MKRSAAEIIREYGPFAGVEHVHGVTYDGTHVWFASGDRLNAVDPAGGKIARSIDVAAHAGTAFDGRHLFQIAEDRIQKIDAATGKLLSHHPCARWRRRFRIGLGRRLAVGRTISRAQDPSDRSGDGDGSSHHRKQALRHRRDLGRRRALAWHLGRRRQRRAADRSRNGKSAGAARPACRDDGFRVGVRWRRSLVLRRRRSRQCESGAPSQAQLGPR